MVTVQDPTWCRGPYILALTGMPRADSRFRWTSKERPSHQICSSYQQKCWCIFPPKLITWTASHSLYPARSFSPSPKSNR